MKIALFIVGYLVIGFLVAMAFGKMCRWADGEE